MRPSTKPAPAPSPRPVSGERPGRRHAGARSEALDAFRGIAIAAMILVNTPGGRVHRIAALRHAPWNGWTPADLIFPAFLFIVGVAIWLSLGEAVHRGARPTSLLVKALRRSVLIFALGLLLNAFPGFDWPHLRVPGILQRIALCYLLASVVVVTSGARGAAIAAIVLLAVETSLLVLVHVQGPGEPWESPESNVGAALDHLLLRHHLLHPEWDPEGLLGTLSATATTLFGVLAGRFWVRTRRVEQRIASMFAAGTVAVVGGLVLGTWLPINKSLWTASFAIFTAGTSLVMLALCSWLIDERGWRAWAKPFVVYGSNPLLGYVLSSLCDKALRTWTVTSTNGSPVTVHALVYNTVFLRLLPGTSASLAYAVVYVLLWLLPLGLLYRYRIFVKI